MNLDWTDFTKRHRDNFISEWVKRLRTEVGEHYATRPIEELTETVEQAYEANYQIIAKKDFATINHFIDKITKLRLEEGFPLHDVQNAFELYRKIIIPLLADECDIDEFRQCVESVNDSLAYTIHRFSYHFQMMHKRRLQDYADQLEKEIEARTAELRESKRKYKTMIEEINDGYLIIHDGRIAFGNPAFCRMHGYERTEIIDRSLLDFVDDQSHNKIKEIFKPTRRNRTTPTTLEYIRLNIDGSAFPTEITVKPTIYDDSLFYFCICRDITERIRMEEKVREAEKMAYIGQITASLSHEIRNPLSAVKMNLQILKKNVSLRGNDQRRLEISVGEVNRLEGILAELLDFAKPLSFKLQPAPVNRILSECIDLLEIKFVEKKLALDLVLDNSIPEIPADYGKMEQVFINLLLNAIDASKMGNRIQITSQHKPNGRHPRVEITIDDNGSSVPEEHMDEIFKPFFTTKAKGTGLGLPTVKRIVEAHGGLVKVENRNPSGASFQVSLPIGAQNG